MIIDLYVTIDYNDGEPAECFNCRRIVSFEISKIYNNAVRNNIPLNSVEELADTLAEIREEIETKIIDDFITAGNEYVCKCEGIVPVDPAEINKLVANRDKGALKFLGLENATEDELKNWDASTLETLPLVRDFYNGFGTHSPFDDKWTLTVEFLDPNEN